MQSQSIADEPAKSRFAHSTEPLGGLNDMCAQEDGELTLCKLEMEKQEVAVINPSFHTD